MCGKPPETVSALTGACRRELHVGDRRCKGSPDGRRRCGLHPQHRQHDDAVPVRSSWLVILVLSASSAFCQIARCLSTGTKSYRGRCGVWPTGKSSPSSQWYGLDSIDVVCVRIVAPILFVAQTGRQTQEAEAPASAVSAGVCAPGDRGRLHPLHVVIHKHQALIDRFEVEK